MKKILIVEDNLEVGSLVKEYLEKDGFSVDFIRDGYSLISYMCSALAPDIIILDLILPGRNGSDLLCGIKSKWPNTKVFIFSGYPAYESIIEGYIDGFVCKTDGVEILLKTVKTT